jgi:hypothetical protein
VTQTAQAFLDQGLITQAEKNTIVVQVALSDSGDSH